MGDQTNAQPQFFTDVENEQLILTTLLQVPNMYHLFDSVANSDYFLNEFHQKIIKSIDLLHQNKKLTFTIDTLLLVGKENKLFYDSEYIYRLLQNYAPQLEENFRKHCNKLRTDYFKHNIINTHSQRLMEIAYNPMSTMEDLMSNLNLIKREIEGGVSKEDSVIQPLSSAIDRYDNMDRTFVTTGFVTLDDVLTKGLFPSGISVIAGRPGCGKSSFALNMSICLMNSKIPVVMFSLEMGAESVVERLISMSTNIDLYRIIKHPESLTEQENAVINYQKEYLRSNEYFYICDDKKMSIDRIYREIYRFKQAYNITQPMVIFIDLIDKLHDLKKISYSGMNLARVYEIVLDELQEIAKELNVHICLVAQISRESENSKNKRPMLKHLKHSGGLEQAADLVLLLHREAYYDKTIQEDIMEVNVAKQRHGQMNFMLEFLFAKELTKVFPLSNQIVEIDEMDIEK